MTETSALAASITVLRLTPRRSGRVVLEVPGVFPSSAGYTWLARTIGLLSGVGAAFGTALFSIAAVEAFEYVEPGSTSSVAGLLRCNAGRWSADYAGPTLPHPSPIAERAAGPPPVLQARDPALAPVRTLLTSVRRNRELCRVPR